METELTELEQELESAKAENAQLDEKLQRIEAQRHQKNIDKAVENRLKAGLAKDRETEAERLKELDDQTLVLLAEDAEAVAERMANTLPPSPKAKNTKDHKTEFEAAVEDTRMRLFGHRKEAEA